METIAALTPTARDAHLLRRVVEATTPPNEDPVDASLRAGTIRAMFEDMAPSGALEATVACHCIALQCVAMAALRDLAALTGDQNRARASANALSKTLHLWLGKYETIKARAAKTREDARPSQPAAQVAAPVVAPKPATPARPVRMPAAAAVPGSLRHRMLASTALVHGVMGTMTAGTMPGLPSG